jgi:hypothetical protein
LIFSHKKKTNISSTDHSQGKPHEPTHTYPSTCYGWVTIPFHQTLIRVTPTFFFVFFGLCQPAQPFRRTSKHSILHIPAPWSSGKCMRLIWALAVLSVELGMKLIFLALCQPAQPFRRTSKHATAHRPAPWPSGKCMRLIWALAVLSVELGTNLKLAFFFHFFGLSQPAQPFRRTSEHATARRPAL